MATGMTGDNIYRHAFIKTAISKWKKMLALKRMGIITPSAVPSENILSHAGIHKAYKKLRQIRGPEGKVLRREGRAIRNLIPADIKAKNREAVKRSRGTTSEYGVGVVGTKIKKSDKLRGGEGAAGVDMWGGHDNLPKQYKKQVDALMANKENVGNLAEKYMDLVKTFPDDVQKMMTTSGAGKAVGGAKGVKHLDKRGFNPRFLRTQKPVTTYHNHFEVEDLKKVKTQGAQDILHSLSADPRAPLLGNKSIRDMGLNPESRIKSREIPRSLTKKKYRVEAEQDKFMQFASKYETRRSLSSHDQGARLIMPSSGDVVGYAQTPIESKHYTGSKRHFSRNITKPINSKGNKNTLGVEVTAFEPPNSKARDIHKVFKTVNKRPTSFREQAAAQDLVKPDAPRRLRKPNMPDVTYGRINKFFGGEPPREYSRTTIKSISPDDLKNMSEFFGVKSARTVKGIFGKSKPKKS